MCCFEHCTSDRFSLVIYKTKERKKKLDFCVSFCCLKHLSVSKQSTCKTNAFHGVFFFFSFPFLIEVWKCFEHREKANSKHTILKIKRYAINIVFREKWNKRRGMARNKAQVKWFFALVYSNRNGAIFIRFYLSINRFIGRIFIYCLLNNGFLSFGFGFVFSRRDFKRVNVFRSLNLTPLHHHLVLFSKVNGKKNIVIKIWCGKIKCHSQYIFIFWLEI